MFGKRFLPTGTVIAVAAAALLLAACGTTSGGSADNGTAGDGATSPGPEATGTASPLPSGGTPSVVPPLETTPTPTDPALPLPSGTATVTVRGTVTEGVEAGCLILGKYQLVVADSQLRDTVRPGASIEVTGQVMDNIMSLCMQGTPLVVTSARPL